MDGCFYQHAKKKKSVVKSHKDADKKILAQAHDLTQQSAHRHRPSICCTFPSTTRDQLMMDAMADICRMA